MAHTTAVTGLPLSGDPFRRRAGRDAAFVALALTGVLVTYLATAESPPLATGAVVMLAAATTMHARLAMGRWIAGGQVALCAGALALAGAPPRLVGAALLSGLCAAELVARCTQRTAVLQVGVWTAIIAGVASATGIIAAVPLPAMLAMREALGAVIGGLLAAPLLLALGPLVEWVFGHTTRLTISEWLSYEHPLLRQLAAIAPGTFQHSINVGVLADAAAGAIGADRLIARVGGLYHDVGKLRAPDYFIENQQHENPHDRLDPLDSARILRAHVLDGVELLRAHRMGGRLTDFVREHHGTSLMRIFADKAAKLGRPIDDDEYRYPGPRPRTRETAIVMIADQVEATARATLPADEAACTALVRRTIARNQEERQFDDSGLTARDLARLEPAFARAVQAMYHRRIAYPDSPAPPPPGTFRLLRGVRRQPRL